MYKINIISNLNIPCRKFLQQLNFTIFKGRYLATLNFRDFGEFLYTKLLNFSQLSFIASLFFCDFCQILKNVNNWCCKYFLR